MTTTDFAPGDRVTIDLPRYAGRVFTVERRLQRNYVLREEGNPRGVRCTPELMRAHVDGQPLPLGVPYQRPLDDGALVRLSGKDGLFVVLRVNDGARVTYSVTRLGGDHGRYYRGVDRRHLTPVRLVDETTADVED